jgi:predicted Co/Zn/Cd cation transporter (cation efflux family)
MLDERAALRLSAGGALVLGATALGFSAATGSGAILLDGLFNLCFVVTAVLTLRVATLVARPDDDRYPFGYLFFEPLINAAKGLLLLGVSLFALADAGIALAGGGREVAFGPAIAYAAGATLGCLAVAFALHRSHRVTPSPLVAADVEAWLVSAAISAGVLAGFLVAAFLARRGQAAAAAYVDPAMVALVILASVAIPIRMALTGLAALLNRAASPSVVAGMEALARAALGDLPVERLWIRAIQPGRTAFVTVHVLVPEGTALGLAEADRLRGAVIAALAARHAPVVVDVVFTAVEAFAAPTAGYTA